MLYIVGLGLADEKDISVRGLEIVCKAERVYLEAYTAVLLVEKAQLVRPDSQTANDGDFKIDTNMRTSSRKPTMAAPSSWPTAKWSNRNRTTS